MSFGKYVVLNTVFTLIGVGLSVLMGGRESMSIGIGLGLVIGAVVYRAATVWFPSKFRKI